jgi:H/ACA ribonucleoprotein complex subunit 4
MERLPSEEERRLIVRSQPETDPAFGCPPGDRSIREYIRYGVVNLDKPRGPTSHEVVAWVKRILGIGKAGHGGTLDPKVTGVLPIALEESTKIVQALLSAGKEYVGVMRLHGEVEEAQIWEAFQLFEGEILQRPPVKSAVKRELRSRRIYYLRLLEMEGRDLLFKVGCEAGTYIRKLCHDLGIFLGMGAHMLELRRTKGGSLHEGNLVTLHALMDAVHLWKEEGEEGPLREAILPVEAALSHLPKVVVRDSAVDAICRGAVLSLPGICQFDADLRVGDRVAMMTLKGELIGIGEAKMDSQRMMIEDTGFAVRSQRILMKPGTYPRQWKTRETGSGKR